MAVPVSSAARTASTQGARFVWLADGSGRAWMTKPPVSAKGDWLASLDAPGARRLRAAYEQCLRAGSATASYRVRTQAGGFVWVGERLEATADGIEGRAWAAEAGVGTPDESIAGLLPAVVYLYDYQADQLLEANAYAARLTGSALDGLDQWHSLLHPSDALELARHRRRLRRLAGSEALPTSFRLATPGGSYAQMSGRETVVAREPGGQPWLVLGVAQDDSNSTRLERDLLRSVLHDAATQLPNRMLFHERLEIAVRSQQRRPEPFAVLMVAIDRFGMVNEGLGRDVGDQVLARIARRLEECVGDDDLVARFGSEQFAVLAETDREGARHLADRVLTALESPFDLPGSTIHISARIGIAIGGPPARAAAAMVHEAEVALSAAQQRTDRVQVYNSSMVSKAAAQIHLDADLRRALEREELRLLYQPICSLATRQVVGFEGLIRWSHPTRGLVAPGEFLDNAGLTGLIVPIGYFALEVACRQLAEWASVPGDFSISVNIDGQQFGQPDLALRIAAIMARHKVNPRRLKLEITETVITQTSHEVAAQLDALRMLGVGILLDDFGTGFSSLGRLRDLPIDTLKIDRAFVHRAGRDEESDEIIRAVLTMARTLNIETIAEGIESHSQAMMLSREGCGAGQGFYYHPPLEPREAARLILRG